MLSAANDIIKMKSSSNNNSVEVPVNRQQSFSTNVSFNHSSGKCVENLGEPTCWNTMSTGAILVAGIIPSLTIKSSSPFYLHRIPYGIRHLIVCLFQALSYIVVAFSQRIEVALFGVVLASLSAGLGELSYLGLTSHYPKETLNAWSSGTGGAGICGAIAYAVLTEPHFFGLNPKTALLSMLIIPFIFMASYWTVLKIAPSVHRVRVLNIQTWIVPIAAPLQLQSFFIGQQQKPPRSRLKRTLDDIHCKLRSVIPLLRYMVPLCIVYISEYLINSGLHQLIYFDCAHSFKLSLDSQFRWYQAMYQFGALFSRSSVCFFQLSEMALYMLPLLQMVMVVVFYCQALYFYIPHLSLILALTFVEGTIGGASYANTFYRIHTKITSSKLREFSLSFTSLGDSLGIAIAAFSSIALYNHICQLRSLMI